MRRTPPPLTATTTSRTNAPKRTHVTPRTPPTQLDHKATRRFGTAEAGALSDLVLRCVEHLLPAGAAPFVLMCTPFEGTFLGYEQQQPPAWQTWAVSCRRGPRPFR